MTKPPETGETAAPSFAKIIAALAGLLAGERLSTGEHAVLRRMEPSAPGKAGLALHRLLANTGVDETSFGRIERWALIVHALALARGRHHLNAGTGRVLHEIGVSEARLAQLLAADSDVLFDLLPRLARRLDAAGENLDWLPLAEIAYWAGADEERADKARLKIARDYARAQHREKA